jgi:hypothetical protein
VAELLPNELRLALDGPKGSLDAYLEVADEAQVRRDIRDLIGDAARERRLFAAMAMQGLLADTSTDGQKWASLAIQAVSAADALLAALEQDHGK